VRAIAAMDHKRVIGYKGHLPWHIPEELAWFKERTMGGVLVLGRKTYDIVSKRTKFEGRTVHVLTRDLNESYYCCVPNVIITDKLPEVSNSWLCGGASMYEEFLSLCTDLYLSIIKENAKDSDSFFPKFEHLFDFDCIEKSNKSFDAHHYVRNSKKTGSV